MAVGKAALPMLDTLRVALALPAWPAGYAARPCCPRSAMRWHRLLYRRPSFAQPGFLRLRLLLRCSCCASTGARDFIFFLISGGGSAMFELPLDPDISLEETRVALPGPGGFGGHDRGDQHGA